MPIFIMSSIIPRFVFELYCIVNDLDQTPSRIALLFTPKMLAEFVQLISNIITSISRWLAMS
jgi:hypothetical protein